MFEYKHGDIEILRIGDYILNFKQIQYIEKTSNGINIIFNNNDIPLTIIDTDKLFYEIAKLLQGENK